jgi:hypothetical protein
MQKRYKDILHHYEIEVPVCLDVETIHTVIPSLLEHFIFSRGMCPVPLDQIQLQVTAVNTYAGFSHKGRALQRRTAFKKIQKVYSNELMWNKNYT